MLLLVLVFICGLALLWGLIIGCEDDNWETLGLAGLMTLLLIGPYVIT